MPGDFDFDTDYSTAFSTSAVVSSVASGRFSVTVERGPDSGRTIEVHGAEPQAIVVGLSPICGLKLTDRTVSRRHAELDAVGERLRVRDLGSKNGTFIGGTRIVEAFAGVGDAIAIGESVLRVGSGTAGKTTLPIHVRFADVVGVSVEMRRLFPLLDRLASATVPVLIEGETGTGKEVVAECLHKSGPRRDAPFIVLDCTAIAPSLVESELFGHEKGAFTGAASRRLGVFEQANGGTLFIDELGDLPLDLQAKLLRALETGQVRRVGGDTWIQCDARLVAATRRDLDERVSLGQFRDDLFHRLAVGRVALPPLRARRSDIPLLVEHFCGLLGAPPSVIPRKVMERWLLEPWPGNVRELRNAVTRQVTLGDLPLPALDSAFDASSLAPGLAFERILAALAPYEEARQLALALFQRHYTERLVEAHGGRVQRAAEAAGVALRYFQLMRSRARSSG